MAVTLSAVVNKALVPLYLLSDHSNNSPNDIYFGISTTSPGKKTKSVFSIVNQNLFANETQYPKQQPMQTAIARNSSQLTLEPVFQYPVENEGLSLVAGAGGHACALALDKTTSHFYLCPNNEAEGSANPNGGGYPQYPFIAFFSSNPAAVCNSTIVVATAA